MIHKGIDISTCNYTPDFKKLRSNDIDFVMIKASQGHSIYTKIKYYLFEDSKFKANMRAAVDAGMSVGVYHYLTAATVAQAVKEADYFLSRIKPYKNDITLWAAVDVEEDKYLSPLSKTTLTDVVDAFCERVKNAGYRPMIYTNRNYMVNELNKGDLISKYDIWQAHWFTSDGRTSFDDHTPDEHPTDAGDRLMIWQLGCDVFDGVYGYTDINYGYWDDNSQDVIDDSDSDVSVKVGDTVKITLGAVYGGLSSGRGKAVPAFVCKKAYTIIKIQQNRGVNEALLGNGLNSWVSVDWIYRV